MDNKVLILIFCVLNSLSLVTLKEVQKKNFVYGKSCQTLQLEYDSVVCVCNSTYCDFVPEIGPLEEQEFYVYESNKAGKRFDFSIRKLTSDETDDSIELFVNLTQKRQKILGFGGSFTDAAGINIKRLSEATQEALLQTYFSESGSRYNLGRVPIGGSDFSVRPYTYDDIDDAKTDMYLEKFALQEEDYKFKIPFMQKALEINPDLKFAAAAWSAPPWMKNNRKIAGIGFLKREFFQTYANYYVKFLDEYRKYNLTFWSVSTGNEPNNIFLANFNSMGWRPSALGEWVTENLGPTLKKSVHNQTQILLLDDQRIFLPWYVQSITRKNPEVMKYASGIGVHFYTDDFVSPKRLDQTLQIYPDMYLLMTEACVVPILVGGRPSVKLGSWERGQYYLLKMIQNLNHGVSGWIDWNLVLDKNGGPNWAKNNVDAPIIVNPETDEFYKQPLYYAMTHFSRFVPRGSVNLEITETEKIKTAAFETPEKNMVVILCNTGTEVEKVSIVYTSDFRLTLDLSPSSWHTVIYYPKNL